jgi:4-carboxymuconolactone decarboxylase
MSDKLTFGTFGRYTEIPVDQMTPEQRKGYEFVVQERGEAPGPYKILLQNPNLLQVMVPVGRYFQQSHSSLSDAEREIVVNLINAKWHAAYSNYEHELIGERAGLAPEKVQALIAGLHTSFDDPRQQVVFLFLSDGYEITQMPQYMRSTIPPEYAQAPTKYGPKTFHVASDCER